MGDRRSGPGSGAAAPWVLASYALLATALAAVALLFDDFPVTIDEPTNRVYGILALRYYLSLGADKQLFAYQDLYLYGAWYQALVAAVAAAAGDDGFAVRHLMGGLFGWAGLALAWHLARRLAGDRAAFFATALTLLTGMTAGHAFNTPADQPFATAVLATLATTLAMDRWLAAGRGAAHGACVGLALGMTCALRIGGLFLVPLVGAYALHRWIATGRRDVGGFLRWAGAAAGTFAGALVLGWPWLLENVLGRMLKSLAHFSALPNMAGPMKSCGGIVDAGALPWHYVPCELAARLPELTVVLLALVPALLVARLRGALRGDAAATLLGPHAAGWTLVALAVAVPVATAAALNVILYDGVRHFLFAIPLLSIVAAAVLDGAWALAPGAWRPAAAALLAAYGAAKLADLATLHPVAYVHINQAFGGPAAAQDGFELDYADGGLQLGARWLARRLAPAGEAASARICVDWRDDLWFMVPGLRQPAPGEPPAFIVTGNRSACVLPAGAQLLGQVERRGLVLARIYRAGGVAPR